MRRTVLALVLVLACAGSAPAAGEDQLPWPNLLPAGPVPTRVQPHAVPNCPVASIACVDGLITRLQTQWRGLDTSCDHRALFSIAYLRITEGLKQAIIDGRIRYPGWFEYVVTDFSNHYIAAFEDYEADRPVPESWRITFDAARSGDANGGQDVLLASNAHTQHDLPYIYAEMGMATRRGASRKHDHDAVNEVNNQVFSTLQAYYAERYDPFFSLTDSLKPATMGANEMVKGWRELAWRNAERLINARTRAERKVIDAEIDVNANTWARLIATPTQPGYRAVRDSWCRRPRL